MTDMIFYVTLKMIWRLYWNSFKWNSMKAKVKLTFLLNVNSIKIKEATNMVLTIDNSKF